MENEKYELSYSNEIDSTILIFKQKCPDDVFKKAYSEMLEMFKENNCFKHITDTSGMGVVSVENQKWVGQEIVANMKAAAPAGKKLHVALVLGDDIFATVAAKNIERMTEEEKTMYVNEFSSISAAKSWIKEVK